MKKIKDAVKNYSIKVCYSDVWEEIYASECQNGFIFDNKNIVIKKTYHHEQITFFYASILIYLIEKI